MSKEMRMVGLKMSPAVYLPHFILHDHFSVTSAVSRSFSTLVHTSTLMCGPLPPFELLQGKKSLNLKGSSVFRQIASMGHPDFQPGVFSQQWLLLSGPFLPASEFWPLPDNTRIASASDYLTVYSDSCPNIGLSLSLHFPGSVAALQTYSSAPEAPISLWMLPCGT